MWFPVVDRWWEASEGLHSFRCTRDSHWLVEVGHVCSLTSNCLPALHCLTCTSQCPWYLRPVLCYHCVIYTTIMIFSVSHTFLAALHLETHLYHSLLSRTSASLQAPQGASFSLAATFISGTVARSKVTAKAGVSKHSQWPLNASILSSALPAKLYSIHNATQWLLIHNAT